MSDEEDLFGDDDLFGNEVAEGADPDAELPKKKKRKKDLDFESLKAHGYEPPPSIEESDTYKKIATDRIIRQHEECQADRDQKEKAAEKAQADRDASVAKEKEKREMVTKADRTEVKKRLTVRDQTKDKRAKGQTGISDTANGYWKSDQEFHMTRDTFD